MRLLVDVGNTRTKYLKEHNDVFQEVCVIDNSELTYSWFKTHVNDVHSIVLASVTASDIATNFTNWASGKNLVIKVVSSEKKNFGICSGYESPKQLGVDRWLAIIGAAKKYPNKNLLIVDAGTATTVDFLDNTGQHHGGWILPGIDSMFENVFYLSLYTNGSNR